MWAVMYCSRLRQNQNTAVSSHLSSKLFTDLDTQVVSKALGHILRVSFIYIKKLYKLIFGN